MGQRTANGVQVNYTSTDSDTARTVRVTGVTHVTGESSYMGSTEISLRIDGTTIAFFLATGTSPSYLENAIRQFTNSAAGASHDISKTHSSRTVSIVLNVFGSISQTTTTVPALKSYTVTYNNNGGTGSHASQTKWHGEPLTLTTNTHPTRTNYVFKNWNTKADGSGTSYSGNAVQYNANANLTLYAQWHAPKTVTYNGNGSTGGSTSSQYKVYNTSLQLRQCGFTKAGYEFAKWNTKADGSGTSYNAGSYYSTDQDLTLYAIWRPLITGVNISVETIRVNDSSSTVEADEGTNCYGTCDYTVTGPASGTLVITVSCDDNSITVTPASFTITKPADQALTGTAVFRASQCNKDLNYEFAVTATVTNTATGSTQVVNASESDILSAAFYTVDLLGDGFWDREHHTGERPGHGIALGGPATHEGLEVFFDSEFNGDATFSGDVALDGGVTLNGSAVGSFATRSSLGIVVSAANGSKVDTAARTANTNFQVDIVIPAIAGYMPMIVLAVTTNSGNVVLRGFDLDGLSTGSNATVKTYWRALAALSANTVTYSAQVMFLKTTLP